MATSMNVPTRVNEVLHSIEKLSSAERLLLAKLLIDSVISGEAEEKADWQKMSLAAFEEDWDNPDDAVYDRWRELYGVSAG